MPKKIKFGIVDGDKNASIWTIKVNGNNPPDVYFSGDRLGSIHMSMHKDGRWHFKFGKIEERVRITGDKDTTDPYMEKWNRPGSIAPGVTVALRIHTPYPTVRKRKTSPVRDLLRIPNASKGFAKEIMVLFVAQNVNLVNANMVGKLDLVNGERLIVVHNTVPILAPAQKVSIPNWIEISLRDLIRGNIGAVFFGQASDGSRVLWDLVIKISFIGLLRILRLKVSKYFFR